MKKKISFTLMYSIYRKQRKKQQVFFYLKKPFRLYLAGTSSSCQLLWGKGCYYGGSPIYSSTAEAKSLHYSHRSWHFRTRLVIVTVGNFLLLFLYAATLCHCQDTVIITKKLKRYHILEYERSCYLSQIISFYFTEPILTQQSGRCLCNWLA